ncbi:hypothetical protein Ahy_A02g007244 [Arachis hypogaea]|uniref:Uncharacterized protein n=1 Tax=Arachis hypogaea TaxID=3818 RepID=A0A445EC38_ARAHY|nr:hypothetical protein Ahy_A02g007244 [Arachis hypogaea]
MKTHIGKSRLSMVIIHVRGRTPIGQQIGLSLLVKKYPNFNPCKAVVYLRSKCDLSLNRNSIARALADVRNIVPIWTGDEAYENFEVYGHPTNIVVDLGKRL